MTKGELTILRYRKKEFYYKLLENGVFPDLAQMDDTNKVFWYVQYIEMPKRKQLVSRVLDEDIQAQRKIF